MLKSQLSDRNPTRRRVGRKRLRPSSAPPDAAQERLMVRLFWD